MKVVAAIDSFKGSMTSMEAGNAVKKGILAAKPDAEVVVNPLADGGEGTVDALIEGLGAKKIPVTVTGPLGEKVSCYYGFLEETKSAVMEMASAAGITLVTKKDPLRASTYGVGEMIADALKRGCKNFMIGIGGSATNDGGIGMLKALGFEFFDEDGNDVGEGAAALVKIEVIRTENKNPLLSGAKFQIACDVKNPLCGKQGGQVSDSDDTTSSSTSTSKDSTRTLAVIESDAKSVEKSVAALQETGDKSLFNEVTKTDENGNKTTGYDTDAIYKAVKNFTDSYNSLIDEVGNSNTKSILRAGASMVNVTEANRKSLSDIGISIGADNKLTIDEEKFKKTDMSKVKAMFADSSYYGTEVKRQAGRAESYAKSEAAKANTYQKSGSYTYNYRTGELYNSTI